MRPPHYTGEDIVEPAEQATPLAEASMRPPHYTGEDMSHSPKMSNPSARLQ